MSDRTMNIPSVLQRAPLHPDGLDPGRLTAIAIALPLRKWACGDRLVFIVITPVIPEWMEDNKCVDAHELLWF